MKYKTLNFNNLNGQLNYRLNDKTLYYNVNGLNFEKSKLCLPIDFVISNEGYITNSLDIKLEKQDEDTYLITYPDKSKEKLDILYYYLNEKNERNYVNKKEIEIKPDGSLEYNGHKIKTYYKSDNGITLVGDYNDFIKSESIIFKNSDLLNLEQEVTNIESTILDLKNQNSEYSKVLSEEYKEYEAREKEVEKLSLDISKLQIELNNTIKANNNALNYNKQKYYEKTNKKISKSYGLEINNDSLPIVKDNIEKYLYSDTDGKNMEEYNNKVLYEGDNSEFNNYNDYNKLAKYYEQKFTKILDEINYEISTNTKVIEQATFDTQNKINEKNRNIYNNQLEINKYKKKLEDKYNYIRDEYYKVCINRNNSLLEYYDKLLYMKKYELNKMNKQLPVLYLINSDRTIIYGFNKYNKISVIFDKYEHQLSLEYDGNYLISLSDEKNNKFTLDYNGSNELVRITNDEGKFIKFDNELGIVKKINYDDESYIIFNYTHKLMSRITDNSGLSYDIKYLNNEVIGITSYDKNRNINEEITLNRKDTTVEVVTNKTKNINHYLFDENNSLITEYVTNGNIIKNITGYEYESSHCNFTFETNKNDKALLDIKNDTITSTKTYYLNLPTTIRSDYTLYVNLCISDSKSDIHEFRTTSYCSHILNTLPTKAEVRVKLTYGSDKDEFGASFNPRIKSEQVLALPITLKEDDNGNVIRPDLITIILDYSNNIGKISLNRLMVLDSNYIYTELNSAKNVIKSYISDIKYPIITNGLEAGYVIKKVWSESEYNSDELKIKDKNHITYFEYDLENNIVNNITKEEFMKYYYNNSGQVIKTLDSNGYIKEITYDDNGNVLNEIYYNESNQDLRYVTDNTYDEDGMLKTDTNSLGFKNIYDGNSVTSPNGFIITNNDNSIISDLGSNSRVVKNGIVSKIISGNTIYKYIHDSLNREKELYIDDKLYLKFEYSEDINYSYFKTVMNDNTGYLKVTDKEGKVLYVNKINNDVYTRFITCNYDENDNLISITDSNGDIVETYTYIDNVLAKTNNKTLSTDIYGNTINVSFDNDSYSYSFNDLNKIESMKHDDFIEKIDYDSLGRIKEDNTNIIKNSYEYLTINNRTCDLIKLHKQVINDQVVYNRFNYDKVGNITKSIINHNENNYHYDGLNRIIRVDSKELNKTFTYSYDSNSNIIEEGIYDYSLDDNLNNGNYINYNYEGDRLVSYGNKYITYDDCLRPIKYNNKELVWDNNRLIHYGDITFKYDNNGLREYKITSNKLHKYIRDGKRLIKEIVRNYASTIIDGESIDNIEIESSEYIIEYNYDINGKIIGFNLDGDKYYFIKNLFGDILKVVDENYNIYAEYQYDIWGNCNIISNINNIANINPIRYRGYYYDNETNLYYLNSRYYDSFTHRFISIDSIEYMDFDTLGGLNLWTYCNNNPIMYVDPDGESPAWWQWLLSGIELVVGTALCFVPGGQVFGIGLISGGAASLTANILDAFGVDSKLSTIIVSGLNIVAGTALCFTPFAGIGAGLIGEGICSIAGGFISEAFGANFTLGSTIGGFAGSIIGGYVYRGITAIRMSHMTPYQKGVMGEKYVKAATGIEAHTENRGISRPDFYNGNKGILIDSKNVKTQTLTNQLKRYLKFDANKYIIYVRLHTKVSKSVKAAGYIIRYFPWW